MRKTGGVAISYLCTSLAGCGMGDLALPGCFNCGRLPLSQSYSFLLPPTLCKCMTRREKPVTTVLCVQNGKTINDVGMKRRQWTLLRQKKNACATAWQSQSRRPMARTGRRTGTRVWERMCRLSGWQRAQLGFVLNHQLFRFLIPPDPPILCDFSWPSRSRR